MKSLYGFVALVAMMFLGALGLITYAIVSGPTPRIPPDLLAIVGAYIILRLVWMVVLLALVGFVLYWAIEGPAVIVEAYGGATTADKERAKKGLCDSIGIFKSIVEMLHQHYRKKK